MMAYNILLILFLLGITIANTSKQAGASHWKHSPDRVLYIPLRLILKYHMTWYHYYTHCRWRNWTKVYRQWSTILNYMFVPILKPAKYSNTSLSSLSSNQAWDFSPHLPRLAFISLDCGIKNDNNLFHII